MDADDLYGLALHRFVPERGVLVKALRKAGDRAQASEVSALRKPSVAGWAVNQLVRTQHDAVADLYAAGDGLREAQADLLAGRGDGRTLRAAGEAERAAVRRLVDTARGLLTSDGHELSETVVERVADTLHAAALDEDSRDQVRQGRLERELRHVGLGLGESPARAPAPAAPKRKATAKSGAKPSVEERAAERERLAAERAAQERVQRERDDLRRAARTAESAARRRAERAARALANAQERHDRAAQALAEAEQELADAREEAAEATAAHERAQAELSAI